MAQQDELRHSNAELEDQAKSHGIARDAVIRGPSIIEQLDTTTLGDPPRDLTGDRLREPLTDRVGHGSTGDLGRNRDELAGDVSYRSATGGRLIARLAHLTVPAEGTKPRSAAQPSELPALDLVAEDFTFRGKQLGRVELVASRAGEDSSTRRTGLPRHSSQRCGSTPASSSGPPGVHDQR